MPGVRVINVSAEFSRPSGLGNAVGNYDARQRPMRSERHANALTSSDRLPRLAVRPSLPQQDMPFSTAQTAC